MSQIEREIKLLDVNVKKVVRNLHENGIEPKGKYIQDVYTFDLPSVDSLYKKYVEELINDGELRKIQNLIKEIRPCFSKEDLSIFESELGSSDILEFILNNVDDYSKLNSEKIIEIMKTVNENFSKWVRLRQTGEETTLTIKKIVDSKGQYELDAVEELEINVPNIDTGVELLENLGYFFERHQIKMRIAFDYKNTEIVIDKWPKLKPYIEVEGPTAEEIEEAVVMLGYDPKEAIVINTDDLYTEIGIDVYSKENSDLSFDDLEKKEVEEYLN